MTRSVSKGPYVEASLKRKFDKMVASGVKQPIKTWSRCSTIMPEFVTYTFAVHNGRKHIPVFVTENMVGFKLGEFSPTRTFKAHGGIKAKKAAVKK
ncbi:MAG: 30S ribosomal protein S19 [Candidatus Omnitrophica bacterium]|nr:30S ribosomal protein S19 [Candidatus Omnitrophota bacterium]